LIDKYRLKKAKITLHFEGFRLQRLSPQLFQDNFIISFYFKITLLKSANIWWIAPSGLPLHPVNPNG